MMLSTSFTNSIIWWLSYSIIMNPTLAIHHHHLTHHNHFFIFHYTITSSCTQRNLLTFFFFPSINHKSMASLPSLIHTFIICPNAYSSSIHSYLIFLGHLRLQEWRKMGIIQEALPWRPRMMRRQLGRLEKAKAQGGSWWGREKNCMRAQEETSTQQSLFHSFLRVQGEGKASLIEHHLGPNESLGIFGFKSQTLCRMGLT